MNFPRFLDYQRWDPDYFYHLGASRHFNQTGQMETLPQVDGLGWGINFIDKEYGYHLLTRLAVFLGDESALRTLPLLLLFLTLLALFLTARRQIGSLPLAAVALLPALVDLFWVERMTMIRPHVLAVLLFTVMLSAMIRGNKYATAALAAVFAFSYHAIQVPLLLAVAWALTHWPQKRLGLALLGGLVVGTLLHPHFPGNLVIVDLIRFILQDMLTGRENLRFGMELAPWPSTELLMRTALSGLVLVVAFAQWVHLRGRGKSERTLAFLLCVTAGFALLHFISPRAREYLEPAACLLLAESLALMGRGKNRHMMLAAVMLVAIPQIWVASQRSENLLGSGRPMLEVKEAELALQRIEADATIFNCNWSLGPYMLGFRPDTKFIDLLDPAFLFRRDPARHQIREDMLTRKYVDFYPILRDQFGANYSICDYPGFNQVMEGDPRFERVYPAPTSPMPLDQPPRVSTYRRLGEESFAPFVTELEYAIATSTKVAELEPKGIDWRQPAPLAKGERKPVYFNFLHLRKPSEPEFSCVWLRPQAAELKRHAQATYLGLGGGPNVRIWIDGKPWYQSRGETAYSTVVSVLVPLPRRLGSIRSLELLVCEPSPKGPEYFGAALSFWTVDAIDGFCRSRGSRQLLSTDSPWPLLGAGQRSCLAPVAAPTKP